MQYLEVAALRRFPFGEGVDSTTSDDLVIIVNITFNIRLIIALRIYLWHRAFIFTGSV
jgi:hypothetical protein